MFWILVFSYWIHLLATAVWLVCIVVMAGTAVPAFRQQQVADNSWLTLQKRLLPWANLSLVLLLLTGFVQMTNDSNYSGFLTFDGVWAWAMLVKHIFFLVVMAVAVMAVVQAVQAVVAVAPHKNKSASALISPDKHKTQMNRRRSLSSIHLWLMTSRG